MIPEPTVTFGLQEATGQKNYFFRRCHLFIILIFSVMTGFSQTLEVGLFGGDSYYLGDLNPGKHFAHSKLAFGALARYNLDSRWAIKVSGYMGKISGKSSSTNYLPDRNLSFESNLTDISAVAEFNFLPYFTGSRKDFFAPFIYGGISVFFFNPKADGYSLRDLGTEGQNIGFMGRKPYGSVGIGIPFGLGVKFSLARNLGLTAFWEMHKTFSDYMDDVSQTYYLNSALIDPGNPAEVLSDPSMNHQPLMERGNPETKDWYSFSGVTLTFKFNLHGSKKCRDTKFM